MRGYEHTQKAPISLLLLACAGLTILLAWSTTDEPAPRWITGGVALFIVLCAFGFMSLTVRDEGEHLSVRFGPLPLVTKKIPYASMTGVAAARSTWLDGWGWHWHPRRGWIYNLWGFDCVRIELGAKAGRIGTDDLEGLVGHLRVAQDKFLESEGSSQATEPRVGDPRATQRQPDQRAQAP